MLLAGWVNKIIDIQNIFLCGEFNTGKKFYIKFLKDLNNIMTPSICFIIDEIIIDENILWFMSTYFRKSH